MTKKPVVEKTDATARSLAPLIAEVRQLVHSARCRAASVVNTLQVMTNFEIGRRIVEHEQKGEKRAEYGAALLKELSVRLTEEFGKGFSVANLQLMRLFFIEFAPRIQQTASVKLPGGGADDWFGIENRVDDCDVQQIRTDRGVDHSASGNELACTGWCVSRFHLFHTLTDASFVPRERNARLLPERWTQRPEAGALEAQIATARTIATSLLAAAVAELTNGKDAHAAAEV